MPVKSICHCGTCQDAWDTVLRDNVKSIEAGECLLWRIQIAVAMTAQCVVIAQEQLAMMEDEGLPAVKLDDREARIFVARVMVEMTEFATPLLETARAPIAAAYEVFSKRTKQ